MEKSLDNDFDMVALWTRMNPTRWLAGIVGGFIAGVVALAFGMVMAKVGGYEILYPIKVMALPFIGNEATSLTAPVSTLIIGFAAFQVWAMFWGFVYSHFVSTNKFTYLLAMGLVWGTFAWVFWGNLYMNSFEDFRYAGISSGTKFFFLVVYGLALSCVGTIDGMVRKK